MDITPHIDSLRKDLTAAAEAAAPEAREAIQRQLFALGPAVRLAMMDAVSQAAAEITAKMPAGTVNVLLEGRDLAFVVQTAAPAPEAAAAAPPVDSTDDDGGLARISLLIPEAVKARATMPVVWRMFPSNLDLLGPPPGTQPIQSEHSRVVSSWPASTFKASSSRSTTNDARMEWNCLLMDT